MQIVQTWMLEQIAKAVELSAQVILTINCRAFEDNQGDLLLANNHCLSNRTHFYNIKFHWFWQLVEKEILRVLGCTTREQRADGMTKPLVREPFQSIRKLNQGW